MITEIGEWPKPERLCHEGVPFLIGQWPQLGQGVGYWYELRDEGDGFCEDLPHWHRTAFLSYETAALAKKAALLAIRRKKKGEADRCNESN